MPDFSLITNFEKRYRAPDTQSLNDKYRNNIEEVVESIPILNLSGQEFRFGVGWQYLLRASFANVGVTTRMFERSVYVPNGITSVAVNIFAASSITAAGNGIRIGVGGATVDYTTLPNFIGIAWQGWQVITGVVGGWGNAYADSVQFWAPNCIHYLRGFLVVAVM